MVLSVYNGEKYLNACLDSLFSQLRVDFEIVVVDDGSTDHTSMILAERARQDPRLRIVTQLNTGLTQALMRGCAEARGAFIARQDCDDLSLPGRLEVQAAVLRSRPSVAVVSCWVRSIGPEGEMLGDGRYPEGETLGTESVLSLGRCPIHGSVMFRKGDFDLVGGYRAEFYFAQDADLWFRLGESGGSFYFVPDILYEHRITESSVSSRYREAQRRLAGLVGACREARVHGAPEESLLAKARKIRPGAVVPVKTKPGVGAYFIGRTLLGLQDPRARGYLRAYIRQRPFDPRGWVSLVQAAFLGRKN